MPHIHNYKTFPCSDIDGELPLYCPECNDSVMWYNGVVMTTDEWNSYYDLAGHLLDVDNNPSINNICTDNKS